MNDTNQEYECCDDCGNDVIEGNSHCSTCNQEYENRCQLSICGC